MLRQVAGHVLNGYPLPADSAFVNQFFNLLLGENSRNHPLFDFITSQCWQTDQGVMAYRFRLAERIDLRSVLPAIQAPTLLINGDQDVLVTEEGLGAYRQALASAEFVGLSGAGHLAFVTHAVETARVADGFARRLGLLEWEN
jgi:pimeloyl-ACP methyl ester carboxylesterase